MTAEGKLFFDFETNGSLPTALLEACREAVDRKIDSIDNWNDGDNERNKWIKLWNVPTDHGAMVDYINGKFGQLQGLVAEEDPTAPIAYCYSGDSRICYHPHPLKLDGQSLTVTEQGITMKIIIVLTYKTRCFPV